MPDDTYLKIDGQVGDIFAHRFVIRTHEGPILADLGPKGAEAFVLATGLDIVVEGEMKPSELKVTRIARKGGSPVEIAHKKKPGHDAHAEPRDARNAVEKAGYETLGAPRRKPKHFEVLGRKDGRLVECHVEFDGRIRKEKPVAPGDEKWSSELRAA